MANLIANLQRPALVKAPNKTLAAQLFSEFQGFLPHNAVEYFISYYDYYQPEAYVHRPIRISQKIVPSTTTSIVCAILQLCHCLKGPDTIIVAV